jgi:hypothetical protein
MTRDELALALAAEMGGDISVETEKYLRGEHTRSFGLITEVAAIGSFLAQAAQLAIQIYQVRRDRGYLIAVLDEQAPSPAKIAPEKRRSMIERLADILAKTK